MTHLTRNVPYSLVDFQVTLQTLVGSERLFTNNARKAFDTTMDVIFVIDLVMFLPEVLTAKTAF